MSNLTSLNSSEEEEVDARMAHLKILMSVVPIVVPIIFTLVIIIGFIGNLLVVLVVIFDKTMRNTTNILIFNLALSDLLFIVLCVPFTAADYALTSVWPFGDLWCSLVQYLIIVTVLVSIYTLVLMSVDRFLAVVFPISSITLRTESRCVMSVCLLWFCVLLSSSPVFMAHGLTKIKINSSAGQCSFQQTSVPFLDSVVWDQVTYQICFFIFGYFLPLLLIIGLYSVMIHRLLDQSGACRSSTETMRNKRRVVKLITIVITTFAGSWLPLQVILLCKALGLYPFSVTNISLQIASHVLAYSNSCINPILYAYFSTPFRTAFSKLFFKKQNSTRTLGQTPVMVPVGQQQTRSGLPKMAGLLVQKTEGTPIEKEKDDGSGHLAKKTCIQANQLPPSPCREILRKNTLPVNI